MAESPDPLSQNLGRVVSSASPLGADQQAMWWGCGLTIRMRAEAWERLARAQGAQVRRTCGQRGENRDDAGGAGRDVVAALDRKKPGEEESSSGAIEGA